MNETTTRDLFDRRESCASDPDAGIVLVFAPELERLPNAIALAGWSVLVVGREPPHGNLAIAQSGVSRLHARIARRGEAWTIVDLESRNGTIVRGRDVARALHEASGRRGPFQAVRRRRARDGKRSRADPPLDEATRARPERLPLKAITDDEAAATSATPASSAR